MGLDAGSWVAYLIVFVAAATPVVEILVVIPAGVVAGMPPVPTAAVALLGNLATVALVVVAGDRFGSWWRRRRRRNAGGGAGRGSDSGARSQARRRTRRARALARRWGVPGLALLGPLTTGSHLAALAALAVGAERRRVLGWMTVGLAVWSVAAAGATVAGLDVFSARVA